MRLPPPDTLALRAARLNDLLSVRQLDALVVTSLPNVAYLTGFFASAAALIAMRDTLHLVSDARYATALEARSRDFPQVRPVHLPPGASYDQAIVETLQPLRGLRVGFEASHLTVRRFRFLSSHLTAQGWEAPLVETDGVVELLRVKKDGWEVETFRDGAERLSRVAKCILSKALAGKTEADVASEIEAALRHVGFERPSFDTIVASGPNAALPHARAGDRRIEGRRSRRSGFWRDVGRLLHRFDTDGDGRSGWSTRATPDRAGGGGAGRRIRRGRSRPAA